LIHDKGIILILVNGYQNLKSEKLEVKALFTSVRVFKQCGHKFHRVAAIDQFA